MTEQRTPQELQDAEIARLRAEVEGLRAAGLILVRDGDRMMDEGNAEITRLRTINALMLDALRALVIDCPDCVEAIGYDEGIGCPPHILAREAIRAAEGEAVTGRTLGDAASEHAARPISGTNVDARA